MIQAEYYYSKEEIELVASSTLLSKYTVARLLRYNKRLTPAHELAIERALEQHKLPQKKIS